ncbi:MAG: hypothetical protein ACOY5R_02755 [Pseudomonadota bacterium]
MRKATIALSATLALLVGCGPKKLALPSDPIERAATCAIVSAAGARAGNSDIKADLDFAAQTRILHYAMLAASDGNRFDTPRASAVVSRMSDLEGSVTSGRWQDLVQPCNESFPLAAKGGAVELPTQRFEAAIGCYALADFLTKSVTSKAPATEATMSELMTMRRNLDAAIGDGLKARGASKYESTLELKQEALVRMTRLGPPHETAKACTARFG